MEEETRVLIGRSLIRVAGRADKSGNSVIDPTFHFEGHIEIAVSVDAGWEPWSMSLPNTKGIIGVQSPGR